MRRARPIGQGMTATMLLAAADAVAQNTTYRAKQRQPLHSCGQELFRQQVQVGPVLHHGRLRQRRPVLGGREAGQHGQQRQRPGEHLRHLLGRARHQPPHPDQPGVAPAGAVMEDTSGGMTTSQSGRVTGWVWVLGASCRCNSPTSVLSTPMETGLRHDGIDGETGFALSLSLSWDPRPESRLGPSLSISQRMGVDGAGDGGAAESRHHGGSFQQWWCLE